MMTGLVMFLTAMSMLDPAVMNKSLKGANYRVLQAKIDIATAADHAIITPSASTKRIVVTSFFFVAASAVTINFESSTDDTDLTDAMSFAANSGMALSCGYDGCMETLANGDTLDIELGGAVQVSGLIRYYEVE